MLDPGPPADERTAGPTDESIGDYRAARRLARLLDTAVRLPGGFRVGLDGLIGLLPGVGDGIGLALSAYLIWLAARAGARRATLTRMAINVGLDTVVGSIPLAGDLFDMVFKANARNLALLERDRATRGLAISQRPINDVDKEARQERS